GHDQIGRELADRPGDDLLRLGRLEGGVERVDVDTRFYRVHESAGVWVRLPSRSRRASKNARGIRRPRAVPRSMSFLLVPWKSLPPVFNKPYRSARRVYLSTSSAS